MENIISTLIHSRDVFNHKGIIKDEFFTQEILEEMECFTRSLGIPCSTLVIPNIVNYDEEKKKKKIPKISPEGKKEMINSNNFTPIIMTRSQKRRAQQQLKDA